MIIFGSLPIINVDNNAMNIVKHFFYVVIHTQKNVRKEILCELDQYRTSWHLLTMCKHRYRQLAGTDSLLLCFSNMA